MIRKTLYQILIATVIVSMTFFSLNIQGDEESDEVDGVISTVGQNNNSGIDRFELRNSAGTSISSEGGDLQPFEETYTFFLEFSDLDGIDDIHGITFKLFDLNFPDQRRSFDFHSTTGVLQFEDESDPQLLADNALVINWNEEDGFEIVSEDSTITWQLVSSSFQSNSATNFTLEVDFKISKVAKHNAVWYAGALINDGKKSDLFEEEFRVIGDFDMNWYGEIDVPTDSIVRWTEVDAGSGFEDNSANITDRTNPNNRMDVTYISNGYYQQLIKSSPEWVATVPELPVVGHNKAFLTTKTSLEAFDPQEFGIDITFEYDNYTGSLRSTPSLSPVRVDTDSTLFRNHMLEFDRFNDTIWRSRTLETGDVFNNFELRVAVAESFQNATYEGVLTMIIRNDGLNIMNETDYDTFVSDNPTSTINSQASIGVFADTEAQLIKYLDDEHLQVPIYLRNGFLELTTTTSAIEAAGDPNLKPIIGDLFHTEDGATISGVSILYGDLYIQGNNSVVQNVLLKTHYGETRVQNGNLLPYNIEGNLQNLNAGTDSPAGNLFIEGSIVTASNMTIDGSLHVLNGAIATVNSTDTTKYKINHNVFVSNQSQLTLSNYTINLGVGPSDPTKTPDSGFGDIRVTTSSVIRLGNEVQFRDLYLTNSTGASLSSATRTDGFSMTLENNSSFTWNKGDLYEAEIIDSEMTFTGGEIFETLEVMNANVEVSGGHVGSRFTSNITSSSRRTNFNLVDKDEDTVWDFGMRIDDQNRSYPSPSNVTISGGTVENLKSENDATILIDGSNAIIDTYLQTEDNVSVTFSDGRIDHMRMYDTSTLSMHGGNMGKLYTLDNTDVLADGGTFGASSSADEFVSVNHYSTVLITGSANLDLSDIDLNPNTNFHERGKDDALINEYSITDNSDNNGLLIRDDAVVTISATTTINSSTDIELRDNGTLTILKTGNDLFNQIYFDLSATLNEPGTAFSSISSMSTSIIDIYVESSDGGTRPTRDGGDAIAYDFNKIEGSNSAFAKARELYDAHNVDVTVYLAPGSFDNEDEPSINLDKPNLWLMYSVDERTQTRSSGSTSFLSLASAQTGNHAIVDIPVIISEFSNRVDGIYFDLNNQSIEITSSAETTKFYNNDVHQEGGTSPILESSAEGFDIDSNYFTRTNQTNNAVGILLEGPFKAPVNGTTFVRFIDNFVNNIQNDAVHIKDATTSTFITVDENNIGSSSRTIQGHGIRLTNMDLEGIKLDRNVIQYTSNTAILFESSALDGNIDIDYNFISDVDSGYGIHFNNTTFGTFTGTMSMRQNTIETSDTASHGIFFDSINAIDNISLSENDITNSDTALLISSSGTIANVILDEEDYSDLRSNGVHFIGTALSDLDITAGTYRDIISTAVKLDFSDSIDDVSVENGIYERIGENAYTFDATNTVSNIQFTEDRSVSNGHLIVSDNQNDYVITSENLRTISDISQSAIKVSSVTLTGFELNGFTFDQFALEGDEYAGLDINVKNLTGFEVNQALRKVTRQTAPSTYEFDRYDVIDIVFSNGIGPAINFNLSSSGIFENNLLFNPKIQGNEIGIRFTNGPSNPITSVFNTSASFVLNGSQADMESLIADQDNSLTSKISNFDTNTPAGIVASGLKDNAIDFIDGTNSIDFDAFRTTYDDLGYSTVSDTLFILPLLDETQLRRPSNLVNQNSLQVVDAIDRLALNPTSSGIVAEIETTYLLDETDTHVLGVTLDDLNRLNGQLTIQFDAPGSYTGTAYIETEGDTTIVTQATIDRAGNAVSISLPIATTNGSVWTPVGADTVYRVIIDWRDGSNNFVTYSAFMVDFDRSGESRFIDAINAASNGSEIEALLEASQKNAFDVSVSTPAAFNNLFNNVDTNQFTSDSAFNDLLDDLVLYEKALVDALAEANSIDANVGIQSVLIADVINAVSGTSIVRVDDGRSATNESAAAFASRLDNLLNFRIPSIEEEQWVREDIEAETFTSFADFESKLETILNNLSDRTVFDPSNLTVSPSAMIIMTDTAINIIDAYFDQDSGTYPLYVDGSLTETLSPVGAWTLIDPSSTDWETANDTPGSFIFNRTFSFPDGSNLFFDSSRANTTQVAVYVSTIRIRDGYKNVSLDKTGASDDATLNIGFTLDDDGETIAGAVVDQLNLNNGQLEFAIGAPSGYDGAVISTTINGTTTTQSGVQVGSEFTFTIPVATSSGSVWTSLTDSTIYSIEVAFYDGSEGPFIPHFINVQIDRSSEQSLIDVLNAASTVTQLENSLDADTQATVDASSVAANTIYNSLLANLNANTSNTNEISSYADFEILIDDVIAFEELLETAVTYEGNLTRTTTFTTNFYTQLIDNVTSGLSGTDILRIYGNTTDASVVVSNLSALKTNLQSIEVEQWIIEDLVDNHTPTTHGEIIEALNVIYDELQNATIYDASNIVLSPGSIMIATGASVSDVRVRLSADSMYPQYSDSGNTVTLESVTGEDWNLVEANNNIEGSYTYQRIFKFPSDSKTFVNAARDVQVTVTATVSTVTTDSLFAEISAQPPVNSDAFDFDLNFLVDESDSRTIRGSAVDRVEDNQGVITLIVAAPTGAANAIVTLESNNLPPQTNVSYSLSGDAIYIDILYADLVGSDWKLKSSNTTYELTVVWRNNSSNPLMTQRLVGTLTRNTTPVMNELNAAADGASLKALLDTTMITSISDSSINENDYYSLLYANLQTNQFDSFTEFTTLFNELKVFQEASLTSVNYANAFANGDTTFDDRLVQNVLNALNGTSIEKVYSAGTLDASILVSRLNDLNTTLSGITEPVWVVEDVISTQSYVDFEALETRLATIATALGGKVIYDPNNLAISPSSLTVSTGTLLQNVIDTLNAENGNYPLYQESGFTDVVLNQVSDWEFVTSNSSTWSDVNNSPGSETFEATYEFPESSRLYFDVSRTRQISITVNVTIE